MYIYFCSQFLRFPSSWLIDHYREKQLASRQWGNGEGGKRRERWERERDREREKTFSYATALSPLSNLFIHYCNLWYVYIQGESLLLRQSLEILPQTHTGVLNWVTRHLQSSGAYN